MLIGMALFKLEVFSARRSLVFYGTLAATMLPLGWLLIAYGVAQNNTHQWRIEYSFFFGNQFNYWGSPLVSLGYMALIMIGCQVGLWVPLQKALVAVGRMALTNYLLHTVICTTLFNGHGLGWFGYLSRGELLVVVACIWGFQLLFSPWWLARFRYGPFEWLWRSLSYWKWQPWFRS